MTPTIGRTPGQSSTSSAKTSATRVNRAVSTAYPSPPVPKM
ncbi:MAG: hypothetical protein U0869_04800 [Chloroflexota bacterium]